MHLSIQLRVHLLLLFSAAAGGVFGQGWELYYGGPSEDFGEQVLVTADEGYLMAGYSESFGQDNDLDVYLLRTDVDGTVLWSRVYDEGFVEHAYDLLPATDGGYLVVGDYTADQILPNRAYLLRVDQDGNTLWSERYGTATSEDRAFAATPLPDGGYAVTGRSTENGQEDQVLLLRVAQDGTLLWRRVYGAAADDEGRDVVFQNGEIVVAGMSENGNDRNALLLRVDLDGNVIDQDIYGGPQLEEANALIIATDGGYTLTGVSGNNRDAFLLHTDADGTQSWWKIFDNGLGDEGYDLLQDPQSGAYTLAGITERSAADVDMLLLQTNETGTELWRRAIGRNSHYDDARGLAATPDGGFALTGTNSQSLGIFINDVSLVKTNALGDVLTNYLSGRVYFDANNDCSPSTGEAGLADWLVVAEGTQTYYGSTDSSGYYQLRVDTGTYDLRVLPVNALWDGCIDQYNSLEVTSFYDTLDLDFPMHAAIICPALQVDISTPQLDPCASLGVYSVRYCNYGTVPADPASIRVTLDSALTFLNAGIPVNQSGQQLDFPLGAVGVGECGSFDIQVSVSCDVQFGQALRVEALAQPDSICLPVDPNWDGSGVRVDGQCDGTNQLSFRIENIGANPMNSPLNWIVIEDDIVLLQGDFDLDPAESQLIPVNVDPQRTYRIVADQSPGYPGNSFPTVAIEGCAPAGSPVQTGYVTQFPEDEGDAFVAVDVQEADGLSDSSFTLRGYPKGYIVDDTSYVAANVDLEFHLAFQNLTDDTLRRIVIRDTIDPAVLDLARLEVGSSSHPFSYEVYGQGIIKFTLEDLALPPATIDPVRAQGHVRFRLPQRADLPIGTQIRHRGRLFAGYGVPLASDALQYVVGGPLLTDFLVVSTEKIDGELVEIEAFPNPFIDEITIRINGLAMTTGTWKLFDTQGRQVRQQPFVTPTLTLRRNDLPSGIYFWTLTDSMNRPYATGKLIAR